MKLIKKLIAIVIIAVQFLLLGNGVNAANIGETKNIERAEKGYYCVQKWNGSRWIYLTYNQTFYTDTDGQKYIAYCLSPGNPGVGYVSGEKDTYQVRINNLLDNDVIWRVLKNGYPNKSVEELGVETTDDAYFATMQAINAILRGHTLEQAKEIAIPKARGAKLEKIVDYEDKFYFSQPLGGMIAGKVELFRKIKFDKDYGVDIGILLDMIELGVNVQEIHIGKIEHNSKSLSDLSNMAEEVARAILKRKNII